MKDILLAVLFVLCMASVSVIVWINMRIGEVHRRVQETQIELASAHSTASKKHVLATKVFLEVGLLQVHENSYGNKVLLGDKQDSRFSEEMKNIISMLEVVKNMNGDLEVWELGARGKVYHTPTEVYYLVLRDGGWTMRSTLKLSIL